MLFNHVGYERLERILVCFEFLDSHGRLLVCLCVTAATGIRG